MAKTVEARFFEKVKKTEGCWEWQATTDGKGYGFFWLETRMFRAHRFSYEYHVGPIPEGLVLDHLCRNRGCVNPEHLEAVTVAVNNERGLCGVLHQRKRVCAHGHAQADANIYTAPNGRSQCRECGRRRSREFSYRKAEEEGRTVRRAVSDEGLLSILAALGTGLDAEIAEAHGVSRKYVNNIRNGKVARANALLT